MAGVQSDPDSRPDRNIESTQSHSLIGSSNDQPENPSDSRPSTSGDTDWTGPLPDQDEALLTRNLVAPAESTALPATKVIARPLVNALSPPPFSYRPTARPTMSSQIDVISETPNTDHPLYQQQCSVPVESASKPQPNTAERSRPNQTISKKRSVAHAFSDGHKSTKKKQKKTAITTPSIAEVSQPPMDMDGLEELDFTSGLKTLPQACVPDAQSTQSLPDKQATGALSHASCNQDSSTDQALVPAADAGSVQPIIQSSEVPQGPLEPSLQHFDTQTTIDLHAGTKNLYAEMEKWDNFYLHQVRALESQLKQKMVAIDKMDRHKDRLELSLRGLKDDLTAQKHAKGALQQQIKNAIDDHEATKSELESTSKSARDLRQNLSVMRREMTHNLRDLESQLRILQASNQSLLRDLSEKVGELSETRDKNNQLYQQLKQQTDLSSKLQDSRDNKLSALMGSLDQLSTASPTEDTRIGDVLTIVQAMQAAEQERQPREDQLERQATLLRELQTW